MTFYHLFKLWRLKNSLSIGFNEILLQCRLGLIDLGTRVLARATYCHWPKDPSMHAIMVGASLQT
jgi:hypothetical protein